MNQGRDPPSRSLLRHAVRSRMRHRSRHAVRHSCRHRIVTDSCVAPRHESGTENAPNPARNVPEIPGFRYRFLHRPGRFSRRKSTDPGTRFGTGSRPFYRLDGRSQRLVSCSLSCTKTADSAAFEGLGKPPEPCLKKPRDGASADQNRAFRQAESGQRRSKYAPPCPPPSTPARGEVVH